MRLARQTTSLIRDVNKGIQLDIRKTSILTSLVFICYASKFLSSGYASFTQPPLIIFLRAYQRMLSMLSSQHDTKVFLTLCPQQYASVLPVGGLGRCGAYENRTRTPRQTVQYPNHQTNAPLKRISIIHSHRSIHNITYILLFTYFQALPPCFEDKRQVIKFYWTIYTHQSQNLSRSQTYLP